MTYYDLFFSDMVGDKDYYVNLYDKDIVIRKGDKLLKITIENFIIRVQQDKALLHMLKMAGVDFEEYFLPYEMKMYGFFEISNGISTK